MTVDFNALLSKNVGDVEAPKPLPPGSYLFSVGRHEFGESSQKHTPYVRFWNTPVSSGADVDASLLPDGWNAKEMRLDFYLTENAMFMLRDFFEKTLKLNIAGLTFTDIIPTTAGLMFMGTVTQEVNGDRVYSNIDTTAPAE